MKRRLLLLPLAAGAVILFPAAPASAHPLGNFSVNQYLGLTLHPERIDATAVVDFAEIPTLQDRPLVDTDGDGTVGADEQAAHARATCTWLASSVDARAGDDRLQWTIASSSLSYSAGAGGLEVSRLGCALTAGAALSGDTRLTIANGYLADRVGWRELTAVGDGVGLVDSPLPVRSVSNELRDYPQDLLSSVLDVRSATLTVTPGAGTDPTLGAALRSGTSPVSRWMATVDRRFQDLAGGDLTPLVGLLAVLLAIVLGAGHAMLPGHGKTVLAAYLAGKRGRPRDALTVAGTVTLTHTAGVLILGAVLTAGTALAGQTILGWLGLVSGTVVLAVGATMLYGVLRRRGGAGPHSDETAHTTHGSFGAHTHGFGADTHGLFGAHTHGLLGGGTQNLARADHQDGHGEADRRPAVLVLDRPHVHGRAPHGQGPDRPDDRGHGPDHHHLHDHDHDHPHHHDHSHGHDHDHSHEHDHEHEHQHEHEHRGISAAGSAPQRRTGRLGLAGIGIAGGLVPSPSALVVLLAAIGLGRTTFGILLVVAYGVGMAATLAGAGLLLVVVQHRLALATTRTGRTGLAARASALAARLNRATPVATAALVLLVGAGLAARAATAVL